MLFRRIIAAFIALSIAVSTPSFAGYAQLKPPASWGPGLGSVVPGTAGTFNFGKPANGDVFKGNTVLTNAALNVGGKLITVPVSMRVAANAGTFAASFAFGNPYLFAVLAAGSVAYQWFEGSGLQVKNGIWTKTNPQICSAPPCYEWRGLPGVGGPTAWSTRLQEVIDSVLNVYRAAAPSRQYRFNRIEERASGSKVLFIDMSGNGGVNWSIDFYAVNIQARSIAPHDPEFLPVGDPEFHQIMDPKPLPIGLPQTLPIPLPVEPPIFNPDPNYDPAVNPVPRPMWIPTGDPVKQPNPVIEPTPENPNPVQNPDVWRQPGVRVTPAPTEQNPWQVEVTPTPRDSPDSTPVRDPISETPENPIPGTNPDPNANPSPPLDLITCGLPGTPPCKIDEAGTPEDADKPFEKARTKVDEVEQMAKEAVDKAATIEGPTWTFTFQLPTGCAPYETGVRGVILNVCQWQDKIHDLMSMVWAGSTFFCIAGMVGRTIREA